MKVKKDFSALLDFPEGCRAFGCAASSSQLGLRLKPWRNTERDIVFFLVIAGSRTAEVQGISAAGSTSAARRFTAVADAELLLNGPGGKRMWPLPPLPAGISPALISYVASRWIGLDPFVISVGLPQPPPFTHLRIESPSYGPADCISTGHAMTFTRVSGLWSKGFFLGRRLKKPLLLAESVPGGTTTAQAVLAGLGLQVADLISGSGLRAPIQLKKDLVGKGLNAADLGSEPSPQKIIAAVGDPFQPVAVGLLLGAMEARQPVLLGGGSQMVAVLALALAALSTELRERLAAGVVIGTTSWLLNEGANSSFGEDSPLEDLLDIVGDHFGVDLLGLSTGLHFHESAHQSLRDYEIGYVKEGVGAGALALLAQLQGASCKQLVEGCDLAMDELLMQSPLSEEKLRGCLNA